MQYDKKLVLAVFLTSAYFGAAFLGGLFNNISFPLLTVLSLVPTIIAFLISSFFSKSGKK